ncbi:NTP transferase domain-containing protein [Mesoterricola sediminis]|uniref:MobA-like NTP transferase domain-containing protein n=1 Tax=Mesoterricola sediminis TaxID=2927980 RepID=A0AA48H6Q3_9BACT|nr:NTP transferase domain-containing protein [Mesoterricola sediminis]BDU76993.1 hypothetical protein METESE_19510 [Mesoterricola sediminis]
MSTPESSGGFPVLGPAAGLVLLTGGRGRRMGAAKHELPHPGGRSWGGHGVAVFRTVFPEGPLRILGEPLPDHPGLPRVADPRQGPAAALRAWAAQEGGTPRRWWVAPCDQVRWTPAALAAWYRAAEAADPDGAAWVVAGPAQGPAQWLGGFLGQALLPALARSTASSLHALAADLACIRLDWPGPWWEDVDTPEARRSWEAEPRS